MIRAEEMRFSYSRRKPLFEKLSFSIGSGSITGLFGLNGEGKTTLMKLLAGQLLHQGGDLQVMGQVPKRRERRYLSSLFYLPEHFRFPRNATAKGYFDLLSRFYPTYSESEGRNALRAFGIEEDRKIAQSSQGEQKKVLLSFALALEVPLLLLDEPTNGLDIPSKSIFRKLLAQHSGGDRTIIISTHQVRDLEQLIDQLLILKQNRIVCNHSIQELSDRFVAMPMRHLQYDAIYQEESPLGSIGLFERGSDNEYNFSTELFFNAIIAEEDRVLNILNKINQ